MFFYDRCDTSNSPRIHNRREHTKLSHLSRRTRWNGYLIFILTLFIVDVLITNGLYAVFYDVYGNLSVLRELAIDPMAIFFSESFQIGVVVVFVRYCYKC